MNDSITRSEREPDVETRIVDDWPGLVARTHHVGSTSRSTESDGRGFMAPSGSDLRVAAAPITVIPRARPTHLDYGFIDLKRWQGTVLEADRDKGVFLARLRDIGRTTVEEQQVLEADLLIEEISEDDLPLLRPGAVFYWTIGYRSSLPQGRGTRMRTSILRFRRLPVRRVDEAAARARAAELRTLFTDVDDDFADS